MIGTNFMEEIDCGNFFDHIDDLLDFPADDLEGGVISGGGDPDGFQSIWPPPTSDSLPGSASIFPGNNSNSASDLSAELSVPYEDIVQLEWLSNFVEDSFSGGSITLEKEDSCINKDSSSHQHHQFHTSSPVSVLESSSSCSGGKPIPLSPETVVPGRARSKRPRPATFNPRPAIQLISPTSSVADLVQPRLAQVQPHKVPSDSENFAESRPLMKIPKPVSEHKKKKKMKASVPLGSVEGEQQTPPSQGVRKCLHCEITKTPQWRAGPMGPKTLCNACGVRYKSGRLFPEYRPAASPTFVPSVHSNSHKKVLEMRTKSASEAPTELIPNSGLSSEYM